MERSLIGYSDIRFDHIKYFPIYRLYSAEFKALLASFLENWSYTFSMRVSWMKTMQLVLPFKSCLTM